jgi:hypothetical protein
MGYRKNFLRCFLYVDRKNGELRAEHLAETAVEAHGFIDDFRKMVAFFIERTGHAEHFGRTVFYAKTASLAAFFNDGYLTFCFPNGIQIKRFSPKFHKRSLSQSPLMNSNP